MRTVLYLFLSASLYLSTNTQAAFEINWKKPIDGAGLSGVCVKDGLIFLTVNDFGDATLGKGFILGADIKGQCYDSKGNFKWEVKLGGLKPVRGLDCWLDATAVAPVANGKYVWFLNVLGELVCCTYDGKVKWKKTFPTNAGITPSELILYKENLIFSFPTGETAGKYNLHRLQALNQETGEVVWKSEKVLNHACRYDFKEIDGKAVILASVSELTHYKIGQGFKVYAISPDSGKCLQETETESFMQHFKCILKDKTFVTVTKSGNLVFTDTSTGKIKTKPSKQCKKYFQWFGAEYQVKGEGDLKSEVKSGNVKLPTKASLNLFGDKLFYFSGGTNAIACYNFKTQETTYVEVPYQIIKGKKIWNYKDIVYTEGVLDAKGKILMNSKKGHGYVGYGWGHVNIAEPLLIDNKVYWLGGVGLVYIIDLSKDFSPESIETVTVDDVGEAWTFGKMAYDDGHLYIRTQKDLFKVKIK